MHPIKAETFISTFALDEMNTLNTRFRKRKTEIKRSSVTPLRVQHSSISRDMNAKYYVPIAVCIETSFGNYDEVENLLANFIKLLQSKGNVCQHNDHNRIYSFGKFAYHIALLTHLNTPPPYSRLIIDFHHSSAVLYEGKLNEFPFPGEPSIAQLYSHLGITNIIELWVTFLTQERTIVYTDNPEIIFYIIKGIEQLLFPLSWPFPKGIAFDLKILRHPQPYFFVIIKDKIPDKKEIHDLMDELELPYCFLEIEKDRAPRLDFLNRKIPVTYPRIEKLKNNLRNVLNKYPIPVGVKILNIGELERNFSNEIRKVFFDEIMDLISGIEVFAKKNRVEELASVFIKKYNDSHKELTEDKNNFIKCFSESQALSYVYDEIVNEFQGNYSRILAMKKSGKDVNGESDFDMASFKLVVDEQEVQLFLQKVLDAATIRKSEERISETEILINKSFDWIKAIKEIRRIHLKKMKIASPAIKSSIKSRYSKNLKFCLSNCSPIQEKEAYPHRLRKKKVNEPVFYGPKGLCCFLMELLPNSYADIFNQHFIEKLEPYFNKALKDNPNSPKRISKGEAVSIYSPFPFTDIGEDESFSKQMSESGIDSESPLNIDSCSSPQFFLYIASYFSLREKHPNKIVKAYMKSYESMGKQVSLYSIFPVQKFKQLLGLLDFAFIRELLKCPGKLINEIKNVYEKKKHKTKPNSLNIDNKVPKRVSSKPLTEENKHNGYNSLGSQDKKFLLPYTHDPTKRPPNSYRGPNPNENIKFMENPIRAMTKKQHINKHTEKVTFANKDPLVVISSLLADLMHILKKTKKKGMKMFKAAGQKRSFDRIERQAASLRVILI